MKSPYQNLPKKNYWKTGVSINTAESIPEIYTKKFEIEPSDLIATAGSCFAQHIANRMRIYGYNVLDVEPIPYGLSDEHARKYGYGIFSARFSNIYTVAHFWQIIQEAFGIRTLYNNSICWEKNNRFFDALRPSVEPDGFENRELVYVHRKHHLECVKKLFETASIFVFTLGLTEAWVNKKKNIVYPTAPGTICGKYVPEEIVFKNYNYTEVLEQFEKIYVFLKEINKDMRFILTVSPIPLTATASKNHILSASSYSKSVLRAVAGYLEQKYDNIDYFPSYEIITNHLTRSFFYKSDLRDVTETRVNTVMKHFFSQHTPIKSQQSTSLQPQNNTDGVVCEDILLEAFS